MLKWHPGAYSFWYSQLGSGSVSTVQQRCLLGGEKKGLFKLSWQWCSATWEAHSWERGHVLLTLNRSNEKLSLTKGDSGSEHPTSLKRWLREGPSWTLGLRKFKRSRRVSPFLSSHNLYSVAVIKLSSQLWTSVPILLKELDVEWSVQSRKQFNYVLHWHWRPTLLNHSSISLDRTLSQDFWFFCSATICEQTVSFLIGSKLYFLTRFKISFHSQLLLNSGSQEPVPGTDTIVGFSQSHASVLPLLLTACGFFIIGSVRGKKQWWLPCSLLSQMGNACSGRMLGTPSSVPAHVVDPTQTLSFGVSYYWHIVFLNRSLSGQSKSSTPPQYPQSQEVWATLPQPCLFIVPTK